MLFTHFTVICALCLVGTGAAPATLSRRPKYLGSGNSLEGSKNGPVPTGYFVGDAGNNNNNTPSSVLERSSPTLLCPSGYQRLGQKCVQTITETPENVCPAGYSLTADQECNRYISKESDCPNGFEMEDGLCRRRQYQEKVMVCPTGYLIRADGLTCSRQLQLGQTLACPAGAVQKGDLCIVERSEAPQRTCPDGFTQEGNECSIEELYNCTPDIDDTTVLTPRLPTFSAGCTSGDCSQNKLRGSGTQTGKEQDDTNNDNPPVISGLSSASFGTTGRRLGVLHAPNSRLPIRSSQTPALLFNPYASRTVQSAGAFYNGTNNSNQRFSAAVFRANPGTAQSRSVGLQRAVEKGNDSSVSYNAPVVSRVAPVSPLPVPPVVNQAPLLATVPVPRAPVNTALHSTYQDYVVQSTCSRIRRVAAHPVCDEGVLDGDICAIDEQVSSVEIPGAVKEESIAAVPQCPENYSPISQDDDLCAIVDDVPIIFYCPSGTVELDDRCLQSVSPNTVCHDGFALEGDVCVQTQFTEPVVEFTVTYSCVGKNCENNNA